MLLTERPRQRPEPYGKWLAAVNGTLSPYPTPQCVSLTLWEALDQLPVGMALDIEGTAWWAMRPCSSLCFMPTMPELCHTRLRAAGFGKARRKKVV